VDALIQNSKRCVPALLAVPSVPLSLRSRERLLQRTCEAMTSVLHGFVSFYHAIFSDHAAYELYPQTAYEAVRVRGLQPEFYRNERLFVCLTIESL